MGLGAPLALLLLAGLSLPWLVHRMRQRDLPVAKLPTIALLHKAMAVTQRRRALEDLLLMLTRMALIALIALALAAPFVWGETLVGDDRPQSLVVVIDDSMSMQRTESGTLLLDLAMQQAKRAVRELAVGSQVGVVAAGRPPRTLATLGAATEALSALSSFTASPARGTDLDAAIDLADATLAAASYDRRTILVLSDCMGRTERVGTHDGPVVVRYEVLGVAQARQNHAVAGATAVRDPDHNGGYRIQVQARSFHSARRSIAVELRADERTLQRKDLALQPDHGSVEFVLNPNDAGARNAVEVALVTDDELTVDDQRDVLLRDPNAVHVLLVNGDPQPAHSSDELHFLSRALPLRDAGATPLAIQTTDSLGLERASFDQLDILWLANVEAPSAEVAQRLSGFVDAGGALVISAGDHVDPATYNARFSAFLPARIEGVQETPAIDLARDSEDHDELAISSTSVGHVATTHRLITATTEHASLTYSDGVAALLHRDVGRGRVVMWTTSIDGDWTDLPYRPGFLALTAGLITALAPTAATTQVLEPGHAVRLAIADGSVSAALIDPSGTRHALSLKAPVVTTTAQQTLLPGAYAVDVTDDNGATRQLPRAAFVIAPPLDESDLTPMTVAASDGPPASIATTHTRTQRPFDGYLFATLLPLFLLEALLRVQRRRASTTRAMPPRSA